MSDRIQVSFKNNERDGNLYDEVCKHNDKSNYIKDCIEFTLKYEKVITYFQENRHSDKLIDDILTNYQK